MEENIREYQKAVRFLCYEIRNGRISVGDRIPTERAIATTLNISRNSTREAIRSLENMGIIESHRGSGNYYTGNVSKHLSEMIRTLLSIRHISSSDISDFRRTMEKAVCMSVISSSSFDPAAAIDILDRTPASLDDEIANDRAFHFELIRSSGNKFWIELMNAIAIVYEDMIRTILESSDEKGRSAYNAIHKRILDALIDKDWSCCELAIDEHYDLVNKMLDQLTTDI